MCRIAVVSLIVLVAVILFERMYTAEYVAFLEHDIQIEQFHSLLREGMTEDEVTRIMPTLPPDKVTVIEETKGVMVKRWSVKEHIGPIHRFLGIQPRDEKSYRELFLDFDENKRLSRIYYGG